MMRIGYEGGDGQPRVHWEAHNAGPAHLHVDPDPAMRALIMRLRGQFRSGSEEMGDFDEMCKSFGIEPWKWEGGR